MSIKANRVPQQCLQRWSAVVAFAALAHAGDAVAADLPAIKTSADSPVAGCATPGRLMAFTRARNDKLDPRFEGIATEYMRHGEALGVRWDIAYFQMLVETGNLKFGGDVRPAQNNFAGLGATGNGEHGESFKDISTGVRAHLEHLLMYAGEKIANPVAERTRKVQEWGVLTEWQKTIKGPMTFVQLARKWAPSTRKYGADIQSVSESFMDGPCKEADPSPELVAAARSGSGDAVRQAEATKFEMPKTPAVAASAEMTPVVASQANETTADSDKVSGAELARRAVAEARSEGSGKFSALGAASVAKGAGKGAASAKKMATSDESGADQKAPATADAQPASFALLNPAKPDVTPSAGAQSGTVTKASAAGSAKGADVSIDAASKPGSCKVFTASYGGTKAIIIKAGSDQGVRYTVLDVNEGSEVREADAYIQAYAPDGKQVGEFPTETKALDKAFELCPEG